MQSSFNYFFRNFKISWKSSRKLPETSIITEAKKQSIININYIINYKLLNNIFHEIFKINPDLMKEILHYLPNIKNRYSVSPEQSLEIKA